MTGVQTCALPISDQLEGAFRPGFFRGVATVVLKLFNMVQPDAALFGKKDYQQLRLIADMTRQMALPIRIVAGETVRADDGLALSSRNGYLSGTERARAPALYQGLREIAEAIRGGNRDFSRLEANLMQKLQSNQWNPDYVAVRKQLDLQSPDEHDHALVVLTAARLGTTRLIDNLEVIPGICSI